MSARHATLPITCTCGGTYRRDNHGRAVCRSCKVRTTLDVFVRQGISPMWSQNTLVTHKADVTTPMHGTTGDVGAAVDAVRADMDEDDATDPSPYVTDAAAAMYGTTRAAILAAMTR